jgi:hypothetical protein
MTLSPLPDVVSDHGILLLRLWYYFTREATIRAGFPEIGHRWERRGTAWVKTAIAPVLCHGTAERKEPSWREAGYAFRKICPDDKAEALVIHFLFGADASVVDRRYGRNRLDELIGEAAARCGIGSGAARKIIVETLDAYQRECERRGLIRPHIQRRTDEDDDMATRVTTWSELASYWGMSVPTAKRTYLDWMTADPEFPGTVHPRTGRPWIRWEDLKRWEAGVATRNRDAMR